MVWWQTLRRFLLCLKRVVSGGDYLTWSDSSKGIIPVLGQDFQPIQTQVKKSNTALGSLDYTPGSSDAFENVQSQATGTSQYNPALYCQPSSCWSAITLATGRPKEKTLKKLYMMIAAVDAGGSDDDDDGGGGGGGHVPWQWRWP